MISDKKVEAVMRCISHRFLSHYMRSDWGGSIWIMERKGNAFARIYWYWDDDTTIYLDNLSVSPKARKKGLGTELQIIREKIGVDFNAKYSCLWVEKNTWQYDWYKRRGYVEIGENTDEPNYFWMKKTLSNNIETYADQTTKQSTLPSELEANI